MVPRMLTVLQVLTGKRPYDNLKTEPPVMLNVITGVKPDRPLSGFSDGLWELLLKAWDPEYGSELPKRPSVETISNQMKEDAEDWDQFLISLQQHQVETEDSCAYPTCSTSW